MIEVQSTVTQVRFDYAMSLVFDDDAVLRIETKFRLSGQRGQLLIDPSNTGDSGPSLVALFMATVEAVEIDHAGLLRLHLSERRELVIEADAQFEAWSVVERTGAQTVCLPGGTLSRFAGHE